MVRFRSRTSVGRGERHALGELLGVLFGKAVDFPGHADGGHHRLHELLVLHELHDPGVGEHFHALLHQRSSSGSSVLSAWALELSVFGVAAGEDARHVVEHVGRADLVVTEVLDEPRS